MGRTNKYSRPLLALLLLVAGLAGAMRPQRVAAQSQPIPGSSLSWEYIPGTRTLTITGSGKMPNFDDSSLPWKDVRYAPKVVIGAGVTSVGDLAFNCFTELTDVSLPDGLQTIGAWAFLGCWSLTNLTLPKSVTSIDWLAFSDCKALKEVTVFWDTPLTISADAFQGIELNKVKLYVPAGKKGAYQAADVWKDFDVQEIPGGTLSTGLHWQYIPSSHTLSITGSGKMPDFDFIGQPWEPFQDEIETATIGAGVTSVGQNAFLGCRALKSVTLPAGLQTIKENAFLGCRALKSVTLPDGLKTLGVAAFAGCDALTSIELPAALETIGVNALNAGGLTEIKVQADNTHFEAEDGVLYNKGKTTLLCYPRKKPGAPFIVPASVTTIEVYAVYQCEALESITLPDALKNDREFCLQRMHGTEERHHPEESGNDRRLCLSTVHGAEGRDRTPEYAAHPPVGCLCRHHAADKRDAACARRHGGGV